MEKVKRRSTLSPSLLSRKGKKGIGEAELPGKWERVGNTPRFPIQAEPLGLEISFICIYYGLLWPIMAY